MGYGDDLLITSYASHLKKKLPDHQIVIGNLSKKEAMHSIVYDNNPNISDCRKLDPKKPIFVIDYHPYNRPYIDYKKSTPSKYVWNYKFKPTPGELYFSTKELNTAEEIYKELIHWYKKKYVKKRKIIFIETSSTKIDSKQFGIKQKNLSWGYKNWMSLINKIKDKYLIIHSNHEKVDKINGIFMPKEMSFRIACAVMKKCDLFLGAHGGFAHVAAALNKKAIVYFGGWADPSVLGYGNHRNIYFDHVKSPCGMYGEECKHCEESRNNIKPNFLEKEIDTILN